MRLGILLAAILLAGSLHAQTTGIPFVNDYTITCAGCGTLVNSCGLAGGAGGISGSTSCTSLDFDVSGGGTFTATVTTTPGAFVTIISSPCCVPCWLPLPPICPFPLTACGGSTNQSVDLDLTCGFSILFQGSASATGVFTVSVTLPPIIGACFSFATQAAITGSIACAGPVIVTQAYNVTLG